MCVLTNVVEPVASLVNAEHNVNCSSTLNIFNDRHFKGHLFVCVVFVMRKAFLESVKKNCYDVEAVFLVLEFYFLKGDV